ncbi:MAG: hypothetical protein E6R04_06710 [Spirochaetes bacterium]|nr:MAG: hypothetical protein E6R04_06710 [Spirochaetota bacterium]
MKVSLNAELRLDMDQVVDMTRREFDAACHSAFGEGIRVSDVQHMFVGVTGRGMMLFRLYGNAFV